MKRQAYRIGLIVGALMTLGAGRTWAAKADLILAEKGKAECVIVVPEGTLAENVQFKRGDKNYLARIAETRRQLLRDSARDLALYLGKMAGAEFEIVTAQSAGDRRLPIFVGKPAEKVFGPVGISKAGAFGFRVVSDPKRGIGLYGETEHGTSYAIYELLHRLGCRWYMPTELGECIPASPTLTVPVLDEKLAPATEFRGMSQGGADWQRRNRFTRTEGLGELPGGQNQIRYEGNRVTLHAGHNMLWRLVPKSMSGRAFNWTDPALADGMAQTMIAEIETNNLVEILKAGYPLHYRLNMPDGQFPTEDPEERKNDPEPRVWEAAAGRWSLTDRLILLANRIDEKVSKQHANVHIDLLGYVNCSMPPARYKPGSNLTWTMAPIDFNRHHPMTYTNTPNQDWLLGMVQAWGRTGLPLGAYWYGINLAELSAPCPFIAKWGTDVRILLENNLAAWNPETMNGWDSMLPGYYLSVRLSFNSAEKPEAILQEMWTRFYGPAAEPMARYWTGIDRAYLDAREYAGSPYGYLKIFTPEVMGVARTNLNEALALCRTPLEYRRVKLIDESFSLFELYMKMRTNWAAGNLRNLGDDYETWRAGILDMVRRYRDPADGTYVQGRHGNPSWSDGFGRGCYAEGARTERDYVRLGRPMLEWKWKYNPGPEAEALPWTAPDFVDTNWPTLHVVRDTWSSIGHHLALTDAASGRSGRMAYRTNQKLPAVPAGKKVFLWIGSTDGSAKLFVNGTHVKYVTPDKGEVRDVFDGYCKPGRFDVTDVLKAGDNQFAILCERYQLNELGTGGLMGPVVLYREK